MYDELIDPYDQEPLRAIKDLPAEEVNVLLASVLAVATESSYPINTNLVAAVFDREISRGESIALREALKYVTTVENYQTKSPTKHVDLLPIGHPLNPELWHRTREDVAEYFLQTIPNLEDRALVASVIATQVGTVERDYIFAQISPDKYSLVAAIDAVDDAITVLTDPEDYEETARLYELFLDPREYEPYTEIIVDENGNRIEIHPFKDRGYGDYTPTDPEKNLEDPRTPE